MIMNGQADGTYLHGRGVARTGHPRRSARLSTLGVTCGVPCGTCDWRPIVAPSHLAAGLAYGRSPSAARVERALRTMPRLRAADGRNGFRGFGPGRREGGRKGFPVASDTGPSRLRNSDDMAGCRPDASGSTLLAALGKRLPLRQADDVRAVAPPSRRSR